MVLPSSINTLSNADKYKSIMTSTSTSSTPVSESGVGTTTTSNDGYRKYSPMNPIGGRILDPGMLGVDVVFKLGNNSPLFNLSPEVPDSSLLGGGGSAYHYLVTIGEHDRAEALKTLVSYVQWLNSTPTLLQSVSGLGMVWNRISKSNYYSALGEDPGLTLKYWETIDSKIGIIMDMYQYITYDHLYHRMVLPDNLAKFTIEVFVYEARNYGTYILDNDTHATAPEKSIKEELIDFSSTTVPPGVSAITPLTPIISTYKFQFQDCKFDLEGIFPDSVDNTNLKPSELELKIVPSKFLDSSTLSVLDLDSLVLESSTNQDYASVVGTKRRSKLGTKLRTIGKSLLKTAIRHGKTLIKDKIRQEITNIKAGGFLSATHGQEYKNIFFEELEPKSPTPLVKSVIRNVTGGILGGKTSHGSASHDYSRIIAEINIGSGNIDANLQSQLSEEHAKLLRYMNTNTTVHKKTVLDKILDFAGGVIKSTLTDKKTTNSVLSHVLK